MDSPTLRRPTLKQALALGIVEVATFLVLFGLNQWLWSQGVVSEQAAFFGEKVRLAFEASPPRMVNIAFVTPIIPYTVTLLIGNPLAANAVTGAITVTCFFLLMNELWQRGKIGKPLLVASSLFVVTSPLCWYILSQRPDLCWFCLIFFIGLFQLHRFYARGQELSLILYGVYMGLLVYVTGEALFLTVLMLPVLWLAAKRRALPRMAIFLVGLFPPLFFVFLSAMVSLAYHPMVGIGEVQSATLIPWSSNLVTQSAMGDLFAALNLTGQELLRHGFLLAPFASCLLVVDRKASPVYLVLGVLPVYVFARILLGSYVPETAFFLIFVVFAVFYLGQVYGTRIMKHGLVNAGIVAALGVAWVASVVVPLKSPNQEERTFFEAVLGYPFKGNLTSSDEASATLNKQYGKVLVDDQVHYKLVYQAEAIQRFILPYHYDFGMALSAPQRFAKFVVVSRDNPKDRVRQRYPEAAIGELEGYEILEIMGELIIFVRKDLGYAQQ